MARLQQYVNRELPDVQDGFRKGRGTRDQIANIWWIMEKAIDIQKIIYFSMDRGQQIYICYQTNFLVVFTQESTLTVGR